MRRETKLFCFSYTCILFLVLGILAFVYGCNDLSCPRKTVLNGTVINSIRINSTCIISNFDEVCFYWITHLSTDFINCTVNNGPYINGRILKLYYDKADNSCSLSNGFINTIPYIGLFLILISLAMLIGFVETYRKTTGNISLIRNIIKWRTELLN